MLEFLVKSKYFSCISFDGMFSIDLNHLEIMFNYYLKTEDNILDNYCDIIYMDWEINKNSNYPFIYPKEAKYILKIIKKDIIKEIFCNNILSKIKEYIDTGLLNYKHKLLNTRSTERKKACKFTQNKNIKKWVFQKYGKKCLSCGSIKKIALDHVIPITKGGKNIKENLQPLCKSCNSKKNNNIIDYRK